MSTRTRLLRLIAVAGVVALGASACSPAQSGAAAVVGDRRVTTDQLQNALLDLRKGNPDFAKVEQLDRLVLFDLIAEPHLIKAARDAGLDVTDAEAQAALPQAPEANADALRALKAQIALNKLTQGQQGPALEGVATALRQEGVRVNPRYGRFDNQSLAILDAQPNWLAPRPTATPTPVPAP